MLVAMLPIQVWPGRRARLRLVKLGQIGKFRKAMQDACRLQPEFLDRRVRTINPECR
jgi:hypothetical protein